MELPDFIQIPSIVIKDKKLHQLDWLVYGVIYWYTKLKLQKCIISNQAIADLLDSTSGSIANSISRLNACKHIKVILSNGSRKEIIPMVTFNSQVKQDSPVGEPPSPISEHNNINKIIKDNNINNSKAVVDKNVDKVGTTIINAPRIMQKRDLLKKMGFNVANGGATYEWQDTAARYAKSLHILKPSSSWFRFFKTAFEKNQKGLLATVYASISDLSPQNPEKYFYKVYYSKLHSA